MQNPLFINVFIPFSYHRTIHHSTLKISPFMPVFQQNLELHSKLLNSTLFSPKPHTHSNHPKQKESPKIKDSHYFPAYPNHILPNVILLNHNLTISFPKLSYCSRLFCANSTFLLFSIELIPESILSLFHKKKP